jgi:hypothetical protein
VSPEKYDFQNILTLSSSSNSFGEKKNRMMGWKTMHETYLRFDQYPENNKLRDQNNVLIFYFNGRERRPPDSSKTVGRKTSRKT